MPAPCGNGCGGVAWVRDVLDKQSWRDSRTKGTGTMAFVPIARSRRVAVAG
jgi:hypothetical protein